MDSRLLAGKSMEIATENIMELSNKFVTLLLLLGLLIWGGAADTICYTLNHSIK